MISRTKKTEKIVKFFYSIRNNFVYSLRDILAEHGITPAQRVIMSVINKKKSPKMKDLSEILGISGSATTQLLKALEKKGIIARKEDERDRRISKISISKKGEILLNKIKKKEIKIIDSFFVNLNEKELENFINLIKKLIIKQI